jgi:uncharacterized protein YbbC (DUF1343 family)
MQKMLQRKLILINIIMGFILTAGLFSAPVLFPPQNEMSRVRLGNELFLQHYLEPLRDQSLGLIVNHTSRLPDGTLLPDAMQDAGFKVAALFSPEHGFLGDREGGRRVDDGRYSGIRIYSLYGSHRRPSPEQLKGLDGLVYDIQDIGARFYTYISTLKYILEAAADNNIPVYVLDRPNPLGGIQVEGPVLQPLYESFIGSLPLPIRYGLTCGELAGMMKGEGWVTQDVDLTIVPLTGWSRNQLWDDTGLEWVPTSPNIPSFESALVYPGTGLLGGVSISHGVGTEWPFRLVGAPWIEPDRVLELWPDGMKKAVTLTPVVFSPRSIPGKIQQPPYENRTCRGFRIQVTSPPDFRALDFTLEMIRLLKTLYPEKVRIISKSLPLLFGSRHLNEFIQGELSYERLLSRLRWDEGAFKRQRKPYLLY